MDLLHLVIADVLVIAIAYSWLVRSGPQFYSPALFPEFPVILKYGTIMVGVLIILTPILQTLTKSWSNDTIVAQTIFLAALHIFFHPYRVASLTPQNTSA